jgi:hypothetical protein
MQDITIQNPPAGVAQTTGFFHSRIMKQLEWSMIMKRIRFPWYEPTAKEDFIMNQVDDLLYKLIAAGAHFYSYCGQQIMYLNRRVIDLFRKSEVIDFLKELNLADIAYLRDIVELLRSRAKPLYQPIPEGTLRTINGHTEPKLRMTRYLHTCVKQWVKHVIESGILSPTQGE